jgi:hypothetical protein
MFEFVLGVVVGAAFSPFWIGLWEKAKSVFEDMKK